MTTLNNFLKFKDFDSECAQIYEYFHHHEKKFSENNNVCSNEAKFVDFTSNLDRFDKLKKAARELFGKENTGPIENTDSWEKCRRPLKKYFNPSAFHLKDRGPVGFLFTIQNIIGELNLKIINPKFQAIPFLDHRRDQNGVNFSTASQDKSWKGPVYRNEQSSAEEWISKDDITALIKSLVEEGNISEEEIEEITDNFDDGVGLLLDAGLEDLLIEYGYLDPYSSEDDLSPQQSDEELEGEWSVMEMTEEQVRELVNETGLENLKEMEEYRHVLVRYGYLPGWEGSSEDDFEITFDPQLNKKRKVEVISSVSENVEWESDQTGLSHDSKKSKKD